MKAPNKPQAGHQSYQHSNHNNPDTRRDTQKHHYADHDQELTDDSNFKEGKPRRNVDLDLRDKSDNLEADE